MSTEEPQKATKKPIAKKSTGAKKTAPERISEVTAPAPRDVEQAPEVSNISLPAIPVSLSSVSDSDVESSLRAAFSGENPIVSAADENVVVAEIEEVVVETESVDTG